MSSGIDLEGLELSTQAVVKEALIRNIQVEILDRDENFIRLTKGMKTEIIRQATKTSADTYVSAEVMGNKEVTKLLLKEVGIRVPSGVRIKNLNEAREHYGIFFGKDLVVKPLSTNFGLGVFVIKDLGSPNELENAVEYALAYDDTVLIEEFISGKEFRFLVVGDEVVAILHREPANVKGDGTNSIERLVEIKNRDPRRGEGYITPLEKIKLGSVEVEFLRKQGLELDYVPKKDEKIYLRENSNISTGGDSIDYTDQVHPGYTEIALKCAKAVGAKITGADIMIDDVQKEPNNGNYGVIELNFNPAIHMHNHPYLGMNREVEKKVLDLLGF
ncbi:bifunctional glutamate--cysteine ligase GshA/glutathione synthetase GshB [Alkalibacter saccharofermentans]|uniref:Glutamate--cysteine ligase n=1 Tax=Alkalibacter saccharofermentans DSM 14828 TaxID=1120975 RepID=A0A1M4YLS6_9FIRM|nr:bifunctional glutamate--cysteine ligase GshA/glutathione synthetase GshB [Alkalibacter saccharofermentans]SHF06701.1 glutamate--cysteine ligase [Alkalibacter saccharofermentans DSM 14828]